MGDKYCQQCTPVNSNVDELVELLFPSRDTVRQEPKRCTLSVGPGVPMDGLIRDDNKNCSTELCVYHFFHCSA